MKIARTLILTSCLCSGAIYFSQAFADPQNIAVNMDDLYNLPLEKLAGLDYTVTSASKREEKLLDTAAAIYVVSQEDIRRSGATSVPEALRGVPGLDVARVNVHTWAISARGFNGQFSNKLLVMIDGRSIYLPEFSGVLWDEQTIPLQNIDRIEIIRGPGATLWGANAVNGIINIITKNARDMQGNLLSVGTGTIDTGFGTARHGGKFGSDGYYTVYATTTDDVNREPYNGKSIDFSWHMSHAGFRTDWGSESNDKFIVEGDMLSGNEHDTNINNPFDPSNRSEGGNVLGQWTHHFSPDSKLDVQSYVDLETKDYDAATIHNDTYDVNVQHTYTGFARNEIVWGAGARFINVRTSTNPDYIAPITFNSDDKLLHVFNGFIQDQYALVPNKWFLTFGSKIEDNSFTGVEIEPSIRTLWKIDDTQSAWAATTRAVRTPSTLENYFNITGGPLPAGIYGVPLTTLASISSNSNIESEQLYSYEIGYRKEFGKTASIDATAFYNSYGNLVSSQAAGNPYVSNGFFVIPEIFVNEAHAKTYGAELAPSWQVTKEWMLKGSYSLFIASYDFNNPNVVSTETTPQSSPRHQFSITSYLNFPHSVEFDNTLSYTEAIDLSIPAYFNLNTRLGWKPLEDDTLELSLAGHNLFNREHAEFNGIFLAGSQYAVPIPQDIIGMMTLKF